MRMRGGLLLWVAAALAAQPGAAEEPAPLPGSGWRGRAAALEEYRLRATPDPSAGEQTLHLGLDLDAGHPSRQLSASASLGLWVQTVGPPAFLGPDGQPAGLDPASLAGVTGAKSPWLAVFTLQADWTPGGALRLLRLGRQAAEQGRPVTFDGATALVGLGPLAAFAFGGRTEHFYEVAAAGASSAGPFESWIGSVGLQARPAPAVKLEADLRVQREDLDTASAGRAPRTDLGWGGAAWLRAGEGLAGKLAVRALGARVSEVAAQARLVSATGAAGLDARAAVQPVELGELVESEDLYFATLGRSLPHARWSADAWAAQEWPALRLELHLGYDGRQLLGGEEEAFNRNTSRARLWLAAAPAALPGLSISAGVDRISSRAIPLFSDGGPEGAGLWAVDAAVSLRTAGGALLAELGTDYHRYQYEYLQAVQERASVRAAWGALRVRLGRGWALRARYQVEVFDRVLHTATLGVQQSWEAP